MVIDQSKPKEKQKNKFNTLFNRFIIIKTPVKPNIQINIQLLNYSNYFGMVKLYYFLLIQSSLAN